MCDSLYRYFRPAEGLGIGREDERGVSGRVLHRRAVWGTGWIAWEGRDMWIRGGMAIEDAIGRRSRAIGIRKGYAILCGGVVVEAL